MSTTFETELSQKQEGAQNSVGVSHGGDMDPNPSAIPATSPDMHKKQTGRKCGVEVWTSTRGPDRMCALQAVT